MTDDFETLREAFRSERQIQPRAAAKRIAIEEATQKFSRAAQGSGPAARLKGRLRGFFERRNTMTTMKWNTAVMGGASLAALTLVVMAALPRIGQQVAVTEPELGVVAPKPAGPVDEKKRVVAQVPAKSEANVLTEQAPASDTLAAASPAPAMKMKADEFARGRTLGYMAEADAEAPPPAIYHDQGRDKFKDIVANPVKVAGEEPVSTFSIDVDTASYSFVRGSLNSNVLPQKDAVRVEELVNYFPYDYAAPADRAEPFKANATLMPTPWNPDTKLLHIGIKGFVLNGQEKPKSNLVFLLDTSGSMEEPNKLPLLQNSMKLLVDTLGPEDTVSIVTYAGNAGTVLEPTKAKDKAKIIAALDYLMAGGSTAGGEGIRQAYQLAEANFDKTGVNRVILATDGDFNVGISDPEELSDFVERKRDTGVYLSVLGFGRGNYNDELMQVLAQNGNGNAAYIDTLNEGRKVLVDEAASTLFPIANDVKIQVEFNPQTVSEYRLIGYETRLLNREDFNNDKIDAGEIGAGHTVTAIYEVTPKDSKAALNDPLRYGAAETAGQGGELAFVKIRYKLPGEKESKLITQPVTAGSETASGEARFAASVAAFGQLLRGGQYTKTYSYDDVIALAQASKGADPFGYRTEFIDLVRIAKTAQGLEKLQ
jgi:Ca-activated chloride channel homolog